MKVLISLLTLVVITSFLYEGRSQGNPANADIVVAIDGSGDFTTLQEAINAAPSNSDRKTLIYIKRGLYNTQKLIIPGDKINISFVGESREETVISYHIYNCDAAMCPPADAALWTGDNILTAATLTILGNGFSAENLTIQNTAGPVGQAQAVTVRADRCTFVNVNLYGYQDTMYFWSDAKRSYFKGCLVVGRTDYIYGSGTVFFEDCEIRSWGGGWITAPSTGLNQPYGFVFNNCRLTYALNSPRGGDDGELVRFGRPWHNYPKVAWLNCEMTEKIHSQGWGDSWNMAYAPTSTDLHLYEYNNTGPGADMSGRAAWAGIKELSAAEAELYTVQEVLGGTDSWDPSAEAPVVQNYTWTGNGTGSGWLVAENWDPQAVPATGETATVDSAWLVTADGGSFAADLVLENKARLDVSANSDANYISVSNALISATASAALGGKVATKDSVWFPVDGTLTLDAVLSGVHPLTKTGTGILVLNADNSYFSGGISIEAGTLNAPLSGSLGKSSVKVQAGATLVIGNSNALFAKAKLEVKTGSFLQLDSDVTLSEFYIDGVLQNIGEYTSATNPGLISGTGKIIIGRPDIFIFHAGANGNWDVPENYVPALLPIAGETVICEETMETTATVFEADVIIQNAGSLRLRGDASKNHTATGTFFMGEGTRINYNTSGAGMYINAPFVIQGNISAIIESSNAAGSTMTLAGPVSGSYSLSAINNGKGTVNSGSLMLTGDNSNFTGTWDLTKYSSKYPTVPGYITSIEGKSPNAFGKGRINAGLDNKVIFSDPKAAGDSLVLTLTGNAMAVLNTDVEVKKLVLNGVPVDSGEYSSASHPSLFEGPGKIIVGNSGGGGEPTGDLPAFPGAEGYGKYVTGGRGGQVIYVTNLNDNGPGSLRYAVSQNGPVMVLFKVSGTIKLNSSLNISKDNITIAGQTAPGDGITLRDYPVSVNADNVIIRFIRFRMGDAAAAEGDALGGREVKNVIVDHCSMSWSTDECVSFYNNENFTLQWCIISESLRNSVHAKGSHGYGGIWGGKNASFHHNLMASHDSRNPRLGEIKGSAFALTDLVDLRNNVIYNWQGNSAYGGEAMNANFVNCYYKPGPATTKTERIYSMDKLIDAADATYPIFNTWGKFFIDGNVLTASTRATNDNWTYGVYNQFNAKYTVTTDDKTAMRRSEPLDPSEVTTHTASTAYEKILLYGGASLARDSVDLRIINDVSTGTATFMDGGNGSVKGIIDTQEAVGGWPVLQSLPAPLDTDNDGMPDEWETANGLDINNPGDAYLVTVDGEYPNLEVYLNSLVNDIVSQQNQDAIPASSENGKFRVNEINMFFNNRTNELNVNHERKIKQISVYSISGSKILQGTFNASEIRWQFPPVKNGIYIARLVDENNKVYSGRIPVF